MDSRNGVRQPTWTGTSLRRLGGELLVLDVEEDPHHGRAGEHHEDADQERVGRARREAADVGQRADQLGRRGQVQLGPAAAAPRPGRAATTPRPMVGAIDAIWALV